MLACVSWIIERRLRSVGRKLSTARDDLAIAGEQLLHLADEADDAHTRSIVSDGGSAGIDYIASQRHTDAMARHRDELIATIARLESTQDDLLDQLNQRRST